MSAELELEPKRKKPRASLQPDSIDLGRPHVPRTQKVDEIIAVATQKKRVILGGTAATGTTSLLELLMQRLRHNGDQAVQEDMFNDPEFLKRILETLETHGLALGGRERAETTFGSRKNKLWILLDDAQKAYGDAFESFWTFLFKTLPKWSLNGNLIIVVASTYDETLGASPVSFQLVEHLTPHASHNEALAIYNLYTDAWKHMKSWEGFRNDLLTLSWLAKSKAELDGDAIMYGEEGDDNDNYDYGRNEDEFHIGVIMAAMWFLSVRYKRTNYTEDKARGDLRTQTFFKTFCDATRNQFICRSLNGTKFLTYC